MKVIIGIHGLDNKPDCKTLTNWWLKAILEGFNKINNTVTLPVFEMVYWADITYSKPLDPEDPYFMDELYTRSPLIVQYSVSQMFLIHVLSKGLKKLKNIFFHPRYAGRVVGILDPIVSKYFQEIDIYLFGRDQTKREKIRERLKKVLDKYKNDDIMLIAHSMGSVIAYDVLLSEGKKYKINTLVTLGSPMGIPYIIKKLAEAYDYSLSESSKLPTPDSIEKSWYNMYDSTDIIALQQKLSENYSANEYGVAPIDVEVVNDYVNRGQRNSHKVFGYLRAKETTNIIIQFINEKKSSRYLWHWFSSLIKK